MTSAHSSNPSLLMICEMNKSMQSSHDQPYDMIHHNIIEITRISANI